MRAKVLKLLYQEIMDTKLTSKDFDSFKLDPLIRPAVEILNHHGFKTFESCQGGEGHCYPEPTVRFEGSEFDLIRAYEICEKYKLAVLSVKRVYWKTDAYKNDNTEQVESIGEVWDTPFNEIVFMIHADTGTIFIPV